MSSKYLSFNLGKKVLIIKGIGIKKIMFPKKYNGFSKVPVGFFKKLTKNLKPLLKGI